MRPTLKDVARLAGVGPMTVSRVVRAAGYISAPTREKVERAIKELGYLPNLQARGLRLNRTGAIALIVADITNPYFTTLARGVEDVVRPEGCLMLMGSSDEDEEEELRYMNLMVQKGVDGVILVPSHVGASALAQAKERQIPAVVVDRRAPEGFDCVRCDSVQGSAIMADHLRKLGHSFAGVIAGRVGTTTSDDRVQGFCEAFQQGGGRTVCLHGDMTVSEGRRLISQFLNQKERPTCFFAVNNFLAIGAHQELTSLGIRTPDDASLAGYDDLPMAMLASPFLTVVVQPAYEMGRCAAQRLLERLKDPHIQPEETILPTSLFCRSSTAPPRTSDQP